MPRKPDYEILSGGGSIAGELPPELLKDADKVVAEFIDKLMEKEKEDGEGSN